MSPSMRNPTHIQANMLSASDTMLHCRQFKITAKQLVKILTQFLHRSHPKLQPVHQGHHMGAEEQLVPFLEQHLR